MTVPSVLFTNTCKVIISLFRAESSDRKRPFYNFFTYFIHAEEPYLSAALCVVCDYEKIFKVSIRAYV